jgi:hypothetical protein
MLQTPPPPPPAIVEAAPTAQEAENALLEAFDLGGPLPDAPALTGAAALPYQWLRAAASFDPAQALPESPFATGPERQEAEALRRLLQLPKARLRGALKLLPLRESGTALALWRWGQLKVRAGAFDAPTRRLWEDRLLGAGPALIRGYALRHALCWALAERNLARFSTVKAKAGEDGGEIMTGFQRLFGLLGGPSPELRFWTLPGLDYRDLRLDALGARRVWIRPAENGPLPELPTGTAWIIPSPSGSLDERAASLSGASLNEGEALASRFRLDGRSAFFAPSGAAFAQLGLVWFPVLLQLDAKGNLRSIRMGDAAPENP